MKKNSIQQEFQRTMTSYQFADNIMHVISEKKMKNHDQTYSRGRYIFHMVLTFHTIMKKQR